MQSLDELPFLNFLSPEFQEDPGPILDALRTQAPLVRTPIGVLVIERSSVEAMLADPRLESSIKDFIALQGLREGPIYESLANSLLALDGPDPRHYPVQIICEMLGVPPEDHDDFARWNDQITWILSFELASRLDEVQEGFEGLSAYIDQLIVERTAQPHDDLVSALILAEDGGDRLGPIELRSMIAGLLFAGYDTTRNQLGISLAVFSDHPDQWARLADEPELAPRAVEECLRFLGAILVAPRMAAQDLDIGGYAVPRGTIVSLGTGSANHDPAAFVEPQKFDITIEREPQLTFGGGPHYCLGASLARAEMQEALPILARRLPNLKVVGEPAWRPRTGIFGPVTLPLTFTPT